MKLLTMTLMFAAGCGSAQTPVAPVGSPEVIFSLDLTTPLPLLTIKATREETARLRSTYKEFRVEMGRSVNGVQLSIPPPRGVLELPWGVYLRNFAAPYPVRLVGIRSDGLREVIREEQMQ